MSAYPVTMLRESNAIMVANAFELANSCECFNEPQIAALYPNQVVMELAMRAKKLAWAARTSEEIQSNILAQRSLNLDPNCAEAYLVLAMNCDSWWTRRSMVREALKAAKHSLPADYFEDPGQKGKFWRLPETRTYMICLTMQADTYYATGDTERAIDCYYEMLSLNPNDNLGSRWVLAPLLIEVSRDQEAVALTDTYALDYASTLVFIKALLNFRRFGPDDKSTELLTTAIHRNPFFAEILQEGRPPEHSDYFVVGERSEAESMVSSMRAAWAESPGSVDWLLSISRQVRTEEHARAKRTMSYKALKRGDFGRIVA
jgi:tetratricopeptide (TPR) repeat protein